MATVAIVQPVEVDTMQPRKCKYCERRFAKVDHLKRHQRTHTGEKPYQCSHCTKRFARSDVLNRHQKAHVRASSNDIEGEDASSISEHGHREQHGRQYQAADRPEDSATASRSPASVQSPRLGVEHSHQEVTSLNSGNPAQQLRAGLQPLEDLTTMAGSGPQNWLEPAMEVTTEVTHTTSSQDHRPLDTNTSIGQARQDVPIVYCSPVMNNSSSGNDFPPTALNFNGIQDVSNHSLLFDLNSVPIGTEPDCDDYGRPSQQSQFVNDTMMPDELLAWFDHFDTSAQTNDDYGRLYRSEDVPAPDLPSPSQRRSSSFNSMNLLVPNERFDEVEQCWPYRSYNRVHFTHTLWREVCGKDVNNIFADSRSRPEPSLTNQRGNSRRGLDEAAKVRLERVFGRVGGAGVTLNRVRDSGFVAQSNHNSISNNSRSHGLKYPPAEVFDMGLDLYFRHFHPLLPFVHIPTFHPKTANVPLLFIMCLIGLNLVNSRSVSTFVEHGFHAALEVVEAELSKITLHAKSQTDHMITSLASGVLLICLSEVLGRKVDESRCHRMYVQLVTLAQEQLLFLPDTSLLLTRDTFEMFHDAESRWKAWSRVESTKRVIMTVILADSWTADIRSSCPILRTDGVQVILPCDSVLFDSKSATGWLELLNQGHQMLMPTIALSLIRPTRRLSGPMDMLGMHGLLCMVRIRISEDFHRLLSRVDLDVGAEQSYVPWQMFAPDSQAKHTPTLVAEIIEWHGEMLGQMNPNCMSLWHNTCIMLTADLRIFEAGAGCMGAAIARKALTNIEVWSQTSAARRAVLHAAQIFKLMSNRRASDGDPFHASYSLFTSALVLALYVFMVPPEVENGEGSNFELLDDVDWVHVGRVGLESDRTYDNDPAIKFIQNGGTISLSGVVQQCGYDSARRILLDFMHLLEDVGKWRVARYTHVLRIMSDSLLDEMAVGD